VAEIKWIKLTTDMFDNRKIKHLRRLPDGNNIVLIWVMLLTMAGRCNAGGMIFLTENIPYTPKMLADELGFEEATVQLALTALENFSMVVTKNGNFTIAGWDEHQNVEGMEKIREQNRIRQQKWYEKQKALPSAEPNVIPNVSLTQPNATEEETEEEKEQDKKKDNISCQQVVDLYHSICKSFPSVRSLSEARKRAIKARLKSYTLEDFKTVFENAEASSFLKGEDGDWKASFDWFIKEANMLKVLEGNYADKGKKGYKEKVPGWSGYTMGEAELEAIRNMFKDEPKEDDPETQREREQLEKELQAFRKGAS
jgi:predicted phage replisome organizer